MNVFTFDEDINLSCQFHPNTYCVKIVLEAAQIISTGYRLIFGEEKAKRLNLYRNTHINHPLIKFAAASTLNLLSINNYGRCLAKEYTYR